MTPALVQRQVALAGVALLAGIGALALGRAEAGERPLAPSETAALGGGAQWYDAVAGSYGAELVGRTTACGVQLTPETRGIAHPVLPCGAKLFVRYGGRTVETTVIDRGPHAGGREFDLTQALAADLGLQGTQRVKWRFATG